MATTKQSDSVKSAVRALEILETVVALNRPLSAQEIGTIKSIPPSSLSYLLNTLVSLNYLVRDGRNYAAGPALARLGPPSLSAGLRETVRPLVTSIRDRIDETAAFFVVHDNEIEAIASAISGQALRYAVEEGRRAPLHAFAAGKALLATFEAERLDAYLKAAPREAFTENTIVDEAALRRELDLVRNTGIALVREEYTRGICALGKVAWRDGKPLGAFSVAIPAARFDAEIEARATELLVQASALLGQA
ncbi:MAG: IclR family transcriptional regulator [Chakrabartia sp.]